MKPMQLISGSLLAVSILFGVPVVRAVPQPLIQPNIERSNLQQYYNQGVKKLASGNFNGAVQDFDKVVQLDPKYAEAYCLRGLAKAQLKNFQAALTDYNQALKLEY
ncbi:hypothetical protein NIES4071_03120 [Calothrix sp. NIES-4071]|nr:hypothetical protein NIES4071_03120 [Calothrix sp. NIES-4071]BAZ54658.1 hypothetical protein NIES4105_03110 [Calothrix sp. NIES-4105]